MIDVPAPTMMHDVAITESRVIFLDLPVVFDLQLAIAGDDFPFRWRPENGARLGVMPHGGTHDDVQWVAIDPCYIFHTLNAWDDPLEPGKVVLEAVRHPDMFVGDVHDFASSPQLWRYEIDLERDAVREGPIDEPFIEFPAVDRRAWGRPHAHGYGIGRLVHREVNGIDQPDTIYRYGRDGLTGRYTFAEGWMPDEPHFVPAPDGDSEDAGWLVGFCHPVDAFESCIYVIDASGFEAGPIARIMLPRRVPAGLHGIWIAG